MNHTTPCDAYGKIITCALTGWAFAYGMREDYYLDHNKNTIDAPENMPRGSLRPSSTGSGWQVATTVNMDRF